MDTHAILKTKSPSLPLGNKRREQFCQLYANEYWGRPGDAMLAANYKVSSGAADRSAIQLLEAPEVITRIKYLREVRSATSVADDAWIKECLVEIIAKTQKDSDRIRALASLKKVLESQKNPVRKSEVSLKLEQMPLPLFEGEDDGENLLTE